MVTPQPFALDDSIGEVQTVYSGTGKLNEPEAVALSELITRLNQVFGTEWHDADRLARTVADDLVVDVEVQRTAVNNSEENFAVVFPKMFERGLLGLSDRDEKAVYEILDNANLAAALVSYYAPVVQARAKVAYQEHVEAKVTVERKGQLEKKTALFVRVANGTREIVDAEERQRFVASRWGGPPPG